MQNKSNRINLYGAFGSALLVSVLLLGLVFLAVSTTSILSYSSNGYQAFLGLSFMGLLSVLFGILPIMLTSRYGWKTVLTTVLIQSILIFLTLFAITLIIGRQGSDLCYATAASSPVNGVAVAPKDCY